jgi:hypothetical protein
LKHGQGWIILGQRGSGKTWTAIQILGMYARLRPRPKVILISPNAASDDTWTQLLREWKRRMRRPLVDKHFDTYNDDVKAFLFRLIDRRTEGDDPSPTAIMADDLQEDHTVNRSWKNNPLRKIIISGRHLKFTLLSLYQTAGAINSAFAINAEVIVSKALGNSEREKFRMLFLEDYSREEFRRVCDFCFRERFDSLVIDRTNPPCVILWRNFTEKVNIKQDISDF